MNRTGRHLLLLLPLLGGLAAAAAFAEDAAPAMRAPEEVAGKVLGEVEPLEAARVYLYHLADFRIDKVTTDERGRFTFGDLPAGLYKVIAHKAGFIPSVVRLTRAAADRYQFVEMQLARQEVGEVRSGETFWEVRAGIPADVLREITLDELAEVGRSGARVRLPEGLRLEAELQAMAGIDRVTGYGSGQLTAGGVDIQGWLGDLQVALSGSYHQLQPGGSASTFAGAGQASAFSLDLDHGGDTRVTVTSLNNRLAPFEQQASPVDFEHFQVDVSQAMGERAHSQFAARYTNESNFYRHGATEPLGIPEASRSWLLEGSFTTLLGGSTTMEAGMRYRQREVGTALGGGFGPLFGGPGGERLDVFSRGGTRVQPAVFVEYGLYTTLLDGSLSLAPRGGVVINLGSDWQAATTVSHRLDQEERRAADFVPTFFRAGETCAYSEDSCYRVQFTRSNEQEEEITFGAIHREFAETLRLYFDDDFFHRVESLYLVPGDSLPELQFAFSRRLAPKILARIESNLAAGGGGVFYATDHESYENQVRYLVTSLDTRFQSTSTGVFIAFHHLQQSLNDLASDQVAATPLELNRLQLMLTQDLNVLLDLATDWAIRLNMEVSRGADSLYGLDDDELRKSILGGIAVKF